MSQQRFTVDEYAEVINKSPRWVQIKCKNNEELPGISHIERFSRVYILYASFRWESEIEKYFKNKSKKIC